ncbi:MAG TPA: hypothetical protein VG675_08970 [Bryobacteraceae bacterium]|nr:hypothetical protein [Bryobacteraceae bacterium]
MFRRLFQFSLDAGELPQDATPRNGTVDQAIAEVEEPRELERPVSSPHERVPATRFSSFEEIYRTAPVKPPQMAYSILKVAEMANSPHIAGMSTESKRGSLLMALDAAGVEVEDLLQDAMVRQRALNDYEEAQQNKLKDFEAAKAEENSRIQAELDRITAQYMSRVQANLDDVARQQDNFRAWQKRKHQEAERISEAAAFCVPQTNGLNNGSLTALLERATGPRR